MKLKKILIPIDFSENSINALRYAAAFAKSSGACIFILHITDPDALENDLKGNLSPEHLLNLLKDSDYLSGIKTTAILESGKVSHLILEEAQKNNVDLIVMGTQGAGSMARNLIGTNTTHVVGKANCPVLAVPAEATFQSIRKVVLAVDLEHRSDHIIEEIVNLMKGQNAAILLAYAGVDKDGRFEKDLFELTKGIKERTGYERILAKVIHSSEFPMSLEAYALEIEADMVIMITHHRGVFESVFDPSQTKLMAYHTHIPLFVIPHHKTPVFFF